MDKAGYLNTGQGLSEDRSNRLSHLTKQCLFYFRETLKSSGDKDLTDNEVSQASGAEVHHDLGWSMQTSQSRPAQDSQPSRSGVVTLESFDTTGRSINVDSEDHPHLFAAKVIDEERRFKLWAGNIGAHKTGLKSLDRRLSNAPNVAQTVTSILKDLCSAVFDLQKIFSGEQAPRTGGYLVDSASVDDSQYHTDDEEDGNETDLLIELIHDCTTQLLRLSVAIQTASRETQFAKSAALPSLPSSWDIQHVSQKFPKTSQRKWLADRLGTGMTRRRQHFAYRRDHNQRLASGVDNAEDLQSRTEFTEATKLADDNLGPDSSGLKLTEPSEDAASETTFRTEASNDSETLKVPRAPPQSISGDPVECPICYNMITVEGRESWKAHVYRDLHPYVCTFQHCELELYASRREWFSHYLEHCKLRSCCFCEQSEFTEQELSHHLAAEHAGAFDQEQRTLLIHSCAGAISPESVSQCPLCNDWAYSADKSLEKNLKSLRKHLGFHLQQLALFSLSSTVDNSEDDASHSTSSESSIEPSAGLPKFELGREIQTIDFEMEAAGKEENRAPAKFKCPHCSKGFQKANKLYRHFQRTHPNEVKVLEEILQSREYQQDVNNEDTQEHENRFVELHTLKPIQQVESTNTEISPKQQDNPRSILRNPTNKFPEDSNPTREGILARGDPVKSVPPNARWTKINRARWTKINRALVDPQALEEAHERFEEREDCVIVLRALSEVEIEKLANRTEEIREARELDERKTAQRRGSIGASFSGHEAESSKQGQSDSPRPFTQRQQSELLKVLSSDNVEPSSSSSSSLRQREPPPQSAQTRLEAVERLLDEVLEQYEHSDPAKLIGILQSRLIITLDRISIWPNEKSAGEYKKELKEQIELRILEAQQKLTALAHDSESTRSRT